MRELREADIQRLEDMWGVRGGVRMNWGDERRDCPRCRSEKSVFLDQTFGGWYCVMCNGEFWNL